MDEQESADGVNIAQPSSVGDPSQSLKFFDSSRYIVALIGTSNSELPLDDILLIVRDLVISEFGFDRAGVFSYDPVSDFMRGVWGTDFEGNLEDLSGQGFVMGELADSHQWTADIQSKGYLVEALDIQICGIESTTGEPDICDFATVLMRESGQLVGCITLDNLLSRRKITDEWVERLIPFADFAAMVSHKAMMRSRYDESIKQLQRVIDISLAITRNDDQDEVFRMARNAILEVSRVDRASLWVVKDSVARGTWGTDQTGVTRDEHDMSFAVEPGGMFYEPFDRADMPFVIDTIRLIQASSGLEIEVPHAFLPLRVGEELIGIVFIDMAITRRKITPAMLQPVVAIADQAAVAVQKSRLLAETEAMVQQQRMLMEIAVAITEDVDIDKVFRMVRDAILETKIVDRAAVFLVTDNMAFGTWGTGDDGQPVDEHEASFVLPGRSEIFAKCMAEDVPYILDDCHSVPLSDGTFVEGVHYALIPLRTGSDWIGFVVVDMLLTKRKLSPSMVDLILPLVRQAAVVVHKSRLLAAAHAEVEHRREIELELLQKTHELTEARDQALAGIRIKSAFLANMSHEIRTPMNGVIGMTSVLMQTSLTSEQLEYCRAVQRSADALLSIIDDVLNISSLEAGMLKISKHLFNIRDCIEDVTELVTAHMNTEAVDLNCYIPVDFPEWLVGDGNRVRQIVTNLLGNAVKFTRAGEVSICLACLEETPQSVKVRIEVHDTGMGIPENLHSSIFESFTQADGALTRKHGGTGLGLTITKQITELMGGTIGLKSQVGVGSEFWLEIPFERPIGQVSELPSVPQLIDKSALIIVENETDRANVGNYVRGWGCRVTAVANTARLAELVSSGNDSGHFDLVVLGTRSNDPDGLKMLSEIRTFDATKHSPVILLASNKTSKYFEDPGASEFAAVVARPVKMRRLQSAFLLALHQQNCEVRVVEHTPKEVVDLGLNILVAEDNPVNAFLETKRISNWGCTCKVAETGFEVLKALETKHFDLILMDVSMPELDGFETTIEIRRREQASGNRIPIIAVTAHAMEGDRQLCLDAGMDDYLPKPVIFGDLLQKLKVWGRPAKS